MPRDGMSLRLDDANILTNIPDTTPEQTAAAARMARDWATRCDVDTAGLTDVLDALGVA